MKNGQLVLVACTVRPGAFSGERVFGSPALSMKVHRNIRDHLVNSYRLSDQQRSNDCFRSSLLELPLGADSIIASLMTIL
jgi:hypothetical protein